jgi:multiple sugar transport system ATP-binding protein
MASITLDGVSKKHPINRKYNTVADLNFLVDDGEFFCLVGPSGAGKTETLRLLAGLDEPDEGDILFNGQSVSDRNPGERDVAMVFENLALYPNKTGFENIELPLKVRGVPEDEREERVRDVAETIGISHLLDRAPETYSGGERQRTGIARAIVREADVYLLDQPLGGLDAKLNKVLRTELKRIHKELNGTFVYVTNNQEEAMSVADRIAVYREGQVNQIGTPEELYRSPINRFVTEFIGSPSVSFYEGSIHEGHVELGSLNLKLDRPLDGLTPGKHTIGVRPHDIELSESGGQYQGSVQVTIPLGSETIVDLEIDGETIRAVTSEPFRKRLQPGDTVGVSIPPEDLYVIDPDDETVLYSPAAQ